MAKIELTLKRTYRPHWGTPESIREFAQNWLDGHDKGFTKSLRWDGGWLVLRNEEIVLPREALLLGFTTKADDRDARGQWGEGLDMGLLVATRAGLKVKVITGAEQWTPKIASSSAFKDEVLCVFTRQVQDRKGTEVWLQITEDEWSEFVWRFLELQPPIEASSCYRGQIIYDEDRRECVYVKGIFVNRVKGLQHGYDFQDARVDLDRMLVSGFDVNWEAGLLWREAMKKEPVRQGQVVWNMLKNERPDVNGLARHLDREPEAAKAVADAFMAEHGEDAIPAVDDHQLQKLEHFGRKGVRVPKVAAAVLEAHYGPFYQVMAKVARQEKIVLSCAALTEVERDVVCCGLRMVSMVVPDRTYEQLLSHLEVVEYQDEKILGTWEGERSMCSVARKTLTDIPTFLETYIHELSHDLSGAGDGSSRHVNMAEHLWAKVCSLLLARTGLDWLDGEPDGTEVRDL